MNIFIFCVVQPGWSSVYIEYLVSFAISSLSYFIQSLIRNILHSRTVWLILYWHSQMASKQEER